MSLDIQTTDKGDGLYEIRLAGRIDTATHGQLEQAINAVFESPVRGVQLDLADVDYVSSMGLRAVMIGMKRANKEGAKLVLSNARPHVKKVFDIAKVLPEESIFSSVAEADAYFDAMQRKVSDKDVD